LAIKRRTLLLAAAGLAAFPAAAAERYTRGLLWRVSRAGAAPSHVFGTLHAADARLAGLPAPVRKAFEGSRALMLEYVADDYGRQRNPERFGKVDFYGWSEDKARQYAVPEREDFGAFIRSQGFSLR